MKRLKFLICLVAAVLAAHGVKAVTLPSTSYSPYSSGSDGYDSYGAYSSGTSTVSGSYLKLSTDYGYEWTDHCAETYPGGENLQACMACVESDWNACYTECSGDDECMDWCDEQSSIYKDSCGRSLPLDAPLWFMLLCPAAIGAARRLRVVAGR